MCETRFHEHWCSSCGKNLNREPKDSYTEIEWSQNERGQIIEEKNMICTECMEKSDNVRELNKFFSELKYPAWGHVFCSSCRKDLTKELGRDIKPGVDYECLNFKQHEKSGQGIKHIIRVVVLCNQCVKQEFNADNIEKLKKLGRNPVFKPTVTCPNTEKCKQFKQGDVSVNCKHIVIGRDRETLQMGLLCGRKHKGALLLPFDDGFSISRPRKGKGAAPAYPVMSSPPAPSPVKDYFKELEGLLEKFIQKNRLGKFAGHNNGELVALEMRLSVIETKLGIQPVQPVPVVPIIKKPEQVHILGIMNEAKKVSAKSEEEEP